MTEILGPNRPNLSHPNEPGNDPEVAGERWWTEPRWQGGRPEITPRRAAAIADKRRWGDRREPHAHVRKLLARCVRGELVLESLRNGELDAIATELVIAALPSAITMRMRWRHATALHRLVNACHRFEAPGVIATRSELGELVGVRARQAFNVLMELVKLGALPAPQPMYEPRGAVTSRRENAWTLTPLLYDLLASSPAAEDRARPRQKNCLASGTVPGESLISEDLDLVRPPGVEPGAARRTSDLSLPGSPVDNAGHAAPAAPCPAPASPRSGETAQSGRSDDSPLAAHLAALAAAGDTFAAETLADMRRDRELRARGLTSHDEYMRRRGLSERLDGVFGKDGEP